MMDLSLLLPALVSVLLLLAAFLILFPNSKSGNKGKRAQSNLNLKNQNQNGNGTTTTCYTREQVAKHNTRTDCWIIVKDKVYDVTSYVEEHPGGDAILNNAGRDSTDGFYGPQHATRVFDMVDEFYIGDLKN